MLLEVSLNLALDEPLKIGIDGGVDPPGAVTATGEECVDEMWRPLGHRVSRPRDDRQVELTAIGTGIRAGAQPCVPKLCAGGQELRFRQRSAGAIRRPLRNHRERERFAQRQAVGRLAEIDAAGRAHPLDVAAERRQVEIRLEQFALGVARLQPQRGSDLTKLAGRRSSCSCR